ncbi:MAG: hypothetical protein F9K40_03130 [Kofleriaceae bacterium]|nr:MAG: hypothetical protein F9K40_03130 [Kofleriaceae bacterium]MBZ0236873.1 hypothetical protein [Kofleriaceae bacterium]
MGARAFTALSPFSNTFGWCFEHSAFLYDSNNDLTLDRPFPRCTSLTTIESPIDDPPHNDAEYFWCVAAPPPMLQNAIRSIKAQHSRFEPQRDRLVDHSRRSR